MTAYALVALVLVAGLRRVPLVDLIETARIWKVEQPVTTAVVAILLVLAWILSFAPLTPLEVSLGYLFGFKTGYVVVFLGKVFGCTASFSLGRTVLRDWAQRQFGKHELLQAVNLAITRQPCKMCFLVRLAYIPIALKNFGLAVVSVSPTIFMVSLVVVEIFNSAVLVTVGSTAKDLSALISGKEPRSAGEMGVMLAGCVFLVGLFTYLSLATKHALQDVRKERER